MYPSLRSTLVLAAVLAGSAGGSIAAPGLAQAPTSAQTQQPASTGSPAHTAWFKQRCIQLVAFYDRYGVGRSANSDGRRNHTRIGAAIECERGNYEQGIRTMEVLLVNKAFDIPEPGIPEVESEED